MAEPVKTRTIRVVHYISQPSRRCLSPTGPKGEPSHPGRECQLLSDLHCQVTALPLSGLLLSSILVILYDKQFHS